MLLLNSQDVRRALSMRCAIDAMKQAFAALSSGRADVPLRAHLPVRAYDGVTLVMPALVDTEESLAMAVKVVSVFPHNAERGLPLIQAAVLAIEPETGRPLALLEGSSLTAIRTGAAAGAATELLARTDSHTAAIFGAGVQGRTQLEAVCTAREIETAWIYGPTPERVDVMIAEMAGQGPIPQDLRRAQSPRQAVADADIVCTATTSHRPVFDDRDLKPGVHINAVGSYQPHVQEIPAETVVRASVFVDSRSAALSETGDLIQPIESGLIGPEHVRAELGEIILGNCQSRQSDHEITLFESVGIAAQDALAVQAALAQAKRLNLGQKIDW